MDANKKVEVNEAFIAEWQKHECLWDVKARAYKDRNAGENACRTLAELFEMTVRNVENIFFFSSKHMLKEEEIISFSKNYSIFAIKFISFLSGGCKNQNQ